MVVWLTNGSAMPLMITTPGRRWIGPEARAHRARESGEFGYIRGHTRHSDAAHHHTLLVQWNSAWIDGSGIAVVHVRFAREDAEPGLHAVDRSRGRKPLALDVFGIEGQPRLVFSIPYSGALLV